MPMPAVMKSKSNRLASSLSTSYSIPLGVSLSSLANSQSSGSDSMANSYSTLSGFSTTSVSSYGSSGSWISQSSSISSVVDLQDPSLEDAYWRDSQYDLLASIPEEPASPRPEQSRFAVVQGALLEHAIVTARAMSPWDYFMSAFFAFFLWMLLCALWGHGGSTVNIVSCAPVLGDNLQHANLGYAIDLTAPNDVLQQALLPLPITAGQGDRLDDGLGDVVGGRTNL